MRQYLKALEDTGAFPQLPDEAGPPEPQPQAKEWVLFYLAQHHDKLGETGDRALLPSNVSADGVGRLMMALSGCPASFRL